MAVKRTVDLGTVGFGLVADTRSLQASLRTLKQFGTQVDNLSSQTQKGAATMYTKFSQIERVLTSLQARTVATTERMKQAGVAAVEIDKVTHAYQRLNNTLTQNAAQLSKGQIARGTTGMSAILARGNKLAGAKEVSAMALGFRDLERAAILAVGPLSGIGARLAVLAALFESNTAKMALFVAGTAGILTAGGLLAAAAIKATMEWQKFDAILTVATGSAALVPDEFNYLAQTANRLGVNVTTLVASYGKFTTAARLSNVPIEDQKRIFEGATVASAAMRLNGERTSLVFLALEQMFSKGVVTMEELRRQLGDLLPGSFGLAAKAMGVTQGELTKLIKAGEVLPQDLLPKIADSWQKVFGPSAVKAAASLQGELQRVGTASFLVLRAFDDTTGSSKGFTLAVRATAEILMYLAENMRQVIQVVGALIGVLAGAGLYGILVRLPGAIMTVITGLRLMSAAIMGVGIATAATGLGGIAIILGKIALMTGGAYLGYTLMAKGIDENTEKTRVWIDETDNWLRLQAEMDASSKQVTQEMSKGTLKRIEGAMAELVAVDAQIKAQQALKEASKQTFMQKAVGFIIESKLGPISREDPQVKALKEKSSVLEELVFKLQDQFDAINNLKIEPDENSKGKDPSEQWKNWVGDIEKSIRKYQTLTTQIKDVSLSDTAVREAKALGDAMDILAAQPDKGRGSIEVVEKALRKAGFEGENLRELLTHLYDGLESQKQKLKDLIELPETIKKANAAAADMLNTLDAKLREVTAVDPESYKNAEKYAVALNKFQEEMEKTGRTADEVAVQIGIFNEKWTALSDAENTAKEINNITKALESLDNAIGDKSLVAAEKFKDSMEIVQRALELGIIDEAGAAQRRITIQDDAYRTMLDHTLLFGKSMKVFFKDLEDSIAKTFVDIAMGGKSTWADLFKNILREIGEFMTKLLVIQPIMKALFGSMYSQQNSDGAGLLGGFLKGLVGGAMGGGGSTTGASSGGVSGGIATAATGSDYIPRDMIMKVHEGEAIVPKAANQGRGGQGSSGGNYNINIAVDASGSKAQGNDQGATDLGRKIEAAVKSVIINERRAGGLLGAV